MLLNPLYTLEKRLKFINENLHTRLCPRYIYFIRHLYNLTSRMRSPTRRVNNVWCIHARIYCRVTTRTSCVGGKNIRSTTTTMRPRRSRRNIHTEPMYPKFRVFIKFEKVSQRPVCLLGRIVQTLHGIFNDSPVNGSFEFQNHRLVLRVTIDGYL